MKFKLKKQVVAGIMAAALLTASVPAVNVSAAKIKYTGTYTKEIEIEKVEKQESSSSNSSSSSTGTNDSAVLMTLATNDNASVIDNTNNSQTGASDNSQTGASNNGSDTAQVNPATVPEPEVQDETVRVMPGMKFVIDATRYGKKVKIEKNKDTFKYKSSNKKIATVSKKGVVTTLKAGKCDITITDKKDGTPFVLHLNVNKTVKVKKVTLDKKSKTYKN